MRILAFVPIHIGSILALYLTLLTCDCAKINTPRVLLPWFDNLKVNFTFEINEGGCYTWSLSRDDIIDLEPIYEGSWGHCSRAARVTVSKMCTPPGSVIILAEEVSSGEILRGDVDIDEISSLKVVSTTWKLFLEEAPEAFEVVASDDQGNTFSTLEGLSFEWTISNIGNSYGDESLVTLVRWSDTDYEAPKGIADLEAQGLRSHAVLLYGQAMGEARVTVCLGKICAFFDLQVVASVVLTPAIAYIAQDDTLYYRVVRARAGRLTVQDVGDTLYTMTVPNTGIAKLEDTISLVRGVKLGSTSVHLMSGATEVASATLSVVHPHSIKVSIRPSDLIVVGKGFTIHCVVFDKDDHQLIAGVETLIRLTVDGEASIDLVRSTENGTITEAMALNSGAFTVTARLHSIAGKTISKNVEGVATAVAIDPLEIDPPELFIAWTDTIQEIQLKHRGGGSESVTWSESETHSAFSLAPGGGLTVRGEGQLAVSVHLTNYPHVKAHGRVVSAPPLLVQVSSTGRARAFRPHALHVALTAGRDNGELYNFHICNCASFMVSLLEGPEPQNVTAAHWIQPVEGACCVLEMSWAIRGACSLRVSRGRAGDTARVLVRAAPALLWPTHAALLAPATLPVLAEGEALTAQSSESRVAELSQRNGPVPYRYPDVQLFTLTCKKKGESNLELVSYSDEEAESVALVAACVPRASRIRLEPPRPPGDCPASSRVWLRPDQEVMVKVSLYDAIGRELLDELGPSVSWETLPGHIGINYKSTDRLFVEANLEYDPVPVPQSYYQLVSASEQAIGWTGTLKASAPDATATIQAKVIAPLRCEPLKVNIAWEGENIPNVTSVEGGSGVYSVEAPKGVTASVEGGKVNVVVPAPGTYDIVVADRCVNGEKQVIEVNVEEVMTVEVVTSRAVGVERCVPARVLVRGASGHPLAAAHADWRAKGPLTVRGRRVCGVREGVAELRAAVAGVWSEPAEVHVFPPLSLEPERSRLPPGGRLQLRARGGPPTHLATLLYRVEGTPYVDVTATGNVHALSAGKSRVKLTATDVNNVELASAEAEVEVIQISELVVRAATQTLLVGRPAPVWLEAGGLRAVALGALQPPPHVTWALRDPASARLYLSHADDQLERSVAEGLTVRVVPLKPGVITIDVRVRNLGQIADKRSWDSSIEILGISDIKTSVDGGGDIDSGERLALVVGTTTRLKSLPKGTWVAYEDGAFELKDSGEVRALKPGHGMILAQHNDESNNIYRETAIHVEVATAAYCTLEVSEDAGRGDAAALVVRSALGRRLLAPRVTVTADPPIVAVTRNDAGSSQALLLSGVQAGGAYVRVAGAVGGASVSDEVWLPGADAHVNRILAVGGWGICLEGVGWVGPSTVRIAEGSGVSVALLSRAAPARHRLRRERPPAVVTVHQLPVDKMEFLTGEWPASFVPLTIGSSDLSSGPLLCTEEQKYALEGVSVELPYVCRTKSPHTAQPVLDIPNSRLGCSIIPATTITESSEVELCAEWEGLRTCTRVLLLPLISVSDAKVSLLDPQPVFTINGHPHALKLVKMTTSPGLKLEVANRNDEIFVTVKGDSVTCGMGWVNIMSHMTSQELQVEVQRECDIACGTLLGAIFSLLKPYLPTLMTIVAVIAAFLYVQMKWQQNVQIRMPMGASSPQTTLNSLNGSRRTWARSPYAHGPAPSPQTPQTPLSPVYGDTSVLPDASFSPNSRSFL